MITKLPSDLPSAGRKPFWSVMIPVYNRTQYLARTLESVLQQDPGPDQMQIEILDNCSEIEDPEPLVRRIAGDRVQIYRQPKSVGLSASFNACIQRAQGEWVHLLHSDDYVLPGFYAELRQALSLRDDVGAAFCRWACVDESGQQGWVAPTERSAPGILLDFAEQQARGQRIQFVSLVVRSSAYRVAGCFREDLVYALDWEMWVRLATQVPFWYEPKLLAAFRVHSQSESSRLQPCSTGTISDVRKAIAIFSKYLPPQKQVRIAAQAREGYALRCLEMAEGEMLRRRFRAGWLCAMRAFTCSHSPAVFGRAAQLAFRISARTVRFLLKKLLRLLR